MLHITLVEKGSIELFLKYVKTTLVLSSCHGNHFHSPSLKVGSHLALIYQIVEIALANSCCLLPSLFKMSIKVGIVRA